MDCIDELIDDLLLSWRIVIVEIGGVKDGEIVVVISIDCGSCGSCSSVEWGRYCICVVFKIIDGGVVSWRNGFGMGEE